MNISIPVNDTMQFIEQKKISPLISKVLIKVCYVGQEPNRNGTVITKETAIKLGESLRGAPIVGFYNEEKQDFEAHNREVEVKNGKFKLVDTTKPYGFVDVNAKVWFQKFSDDGVIHEYLCTEGFLWTGIYRECQRVEEKGNNQSMELNEKYEKGFWTKDSNSGKNIFIISDGLIEKLCILGSDVEPCFEGAQIRSFSLVIDEKFKTEMFSMINELKDILTEGGSKVENEKDISEFEKKEKEPEEDNKKKEENTKEEKPQDSNNEEEDKKKKEKEDFACGGSSGGGSGSSSSKKDKKEKSYNLNEIAEYVNLQLQFNNLQEKYSNLERDFQALNEEANELRQFKLTATKKEKEDMIDSFYMLSDEDKKDVISHIDTYSLDEIEAKLSIICVRNKVDFSLGKDKEEDNSTKQYMLNLQQTVTDNDDAPAWVKAVRKKQEM